MTLWVDEQLPPGIVPWIVRTFGIRCEHVEDRGLDRTDDRRIFLEARLAEATVLTKDADFLDLLERLGPPPNIVLVACGNCTNRALREVLTNELPNALRRLSTTECFVSIG